MLSPKFPRHHGIKRVHDGLVTDAHFAALVCQVFAFSQPSLLNSLTSPGVGETPYALVNPLQWVSG